MKTIALVMAAGGERTVAYRIRNASHRSVITLSMLFPWIHNTNTYERTMILH